VYRRSCFEVVVPAKVRPARRWRARRPAARYHPRVPVLFVFVDGVGAGAADPDLNPLARGEFLLSRFADGSGAALPGGGRAVLADARLGVAGRPQSATGQTTILTGENAPALLGKHLLGFPNPALRSLLTRRSLYRRLAEAGRRAVFANAYPVAYLRALGFDVPGEPEFPLRRRARASATTVAFAAGGGAFRTFDDARAGRGLTHDLTARRAEGLGLRLPIRTPEEAAGIFQGLAAGADLAAFEFFETDEAGHARSMPRALDALDRLDRFLRALVAGLGPEDSLVVTSDHGNLEDLSTRNHTLARVPVLGFGRAAGRVEAVRDLTGLAPLLLGLAGLPGGALGG
jgi:2,3-bisphosphoglycerate-independent phosphoglycerate mutase